MHCLSPLSTMLFVSYSPAAQEQYLLVSLSFTFVTTTETWALLFILCHVFWYSKYYCLIGLFLSPSSTTLFVSYYPAAQEQHLLVSLSFTFVTSTETWGIVVDSVMCFGIASSTASLDCFCHIYQPCSLSHTILQHRSSTGLCHFHSLS